MNAASPWRAAIAPATFVFAFTLAAFLRLTPEGDFPRHSWIAYQLAQAGTFPPHPLYHLALIVFSAGHPLAATRQAAVVMALACGVCAGLSAAYFALRRPVPAWRLTLLCLVLALAMPLPNWWKFPAIYLGQVSPNVWHNPTNVIALPFALAAFLLGLRLLTRQTLALAAGAGILLSLCLLAKPNYFIAFAPCLAVALNWFTEHRTQAGRTPVWRQLQLFALTFIPPALVLFEQAGVFDFQRGSVVIDPLTEWNRSSPNIPVSILLGIAFPLCVLVTYWRQFSGDTALQIAWATLAIAILQFALLSEKSTTPGDANFGWGMMTADRILFISSSEFLLRQPRSKWTWLNWSILGLHAIAGAGYLARALANPSKLCDY